MDANDKRHGTYAGAQVHIREKTLYDCKPCHAAHLRYRRRRRYDKEMGRPRMVDTTPVVAHLRELRAVGVAVRDIADQSGVSTSLIDELLNRTRPVVRSDNADALLATNPPPTPTNMVPAIGTIRRIRALARLGWSQRQLAAESGVKLETLRRVNSYEPPHVEVITAEGVKRAYDRMCMTIAPAGRTASQVRTRAEAKKWAAPLQWDEGDLDNPTARPHGRWATQGDGQGQSHVDLALVDRVLSGESKPRRLTNAEAAEIVRRALARGQSTYDIERLYGLKSDRYTRGAA